MPNIKTDSKIKERRIILASSSPRRRMLLERCGFEPEIVVSDIPEAILASESAFQYTQRLAKEKVQAVAAMIEDQYLECRFIVGADTVVLFEDEVLEKPRDESEAVSMLQKLSGNEHEVVTSFAVFDRLKDDPPEVRTRTPKVRFRQLSQQFIENYVRTGDSFDKAGAYGIQSVGAALVDSVVGSFFAVVGLPIADVIGVLEELGGLRNFPFPTSEVNHVCCTAQKK